MAGTYASVAIKNLAPHPGIGQILTRSLADYKQENFAFFSDEMLLIMQKSMPAHAVKTDTNQLLFFAGWELLSELRRRNIATAQVVIHKKVPDQIELWALQSQLSKAIYIRGNLSSRHECFYDLLNKNKPLWRRIFSTPKPRTTVAALQRLCNVGRGYARGVKERHASDESTVSPLELLLSSSDKQEDKQ
ncbi:hypothetical protein VQ643_06310 [Pseudomonas sp. F1_0610]|uniref:hypothetical protein n=1 Tax=Pseudomonas sp. F1_0610 TaxID=3114284 RepID=UPI0039C06F7B